MSIKTCGFFISFLGRAVDSPITKEGVIFNTCYFRITLDKIEIIRNNGIKSLLVTDTRTGEKIQTTPYSNIFVEQINCLYKKSAD